MAERAKAFALLLCLSLFWGLAFVGIKEGLLYFSPVVLTFLRFLVASAVFAAYLMTRGKSLPLGMMPAAAVLGLLGFTVYHLSLNFGETETSAGAASIVVATGPIFILIFSATLLGERMTLRRLVGIASAFLGLALIIAPEIQAGADPLYVLAILPAPLSTALYSVLGKRYLKTHEPAVLTAYAQLFGLLFVSPLLLSQPMKGVLEAPAEGWGAVLFLGVCSTVVGYTLWYRLLKEHEASIAGGYLYLTSLVAILAGRAILGEPFTLHLVAGGSLVIAGVTVINRS